MEEAFIPFDVEYKFNIQKLRYFGVGEKRFQIITPLADGEQTEDYKTLYDYDKSIYEQGAKLIKEQTDETPAEYTPQLLDVFARAEIGENKDFRYLFLRTASNKIIAALEDFYIEKLKNKIPHEYIEVSRSIDNDDDFDFNIINYKLEANGDEHILLELKERIDLYIGEINLKYQAYFKDNNIDIYMDRRN